MRESLPETVEDRPLSLADERPTIPGSAQHRRVPRLAARPGNWLERQRPPPPPMLVRLVPMTTAGEGNYVTLRRLGDLGRELERRRQPDPYPRAAGPAPSLEELRLRRDEITRVAMRHGARTVLVFGSVARGEAGPGSDLDVLVDMGESRSLLTQAALQGDLEELLGCPVHVVTTGALTHARTHARERIEREAVAL